MEFERVQQHILNRLDHELPARLTYHNAAHTISVIRASESIAMSEHATQDEIVVLKTAALFHDTGYLETVKMHEEASCVIAKETLPKFGYDEISIKIICEMIMATKMPQLPKNKLEECLCDGDLHYIGTQHYLTTAEKLYHEFKSLGNVKNYNDWRQKQVVFFTGHRFFTKTAFDLYESKKLENLKNLTEEHHTREHIGNFIHDTVLMILGVTIAGFGLKGFLVPNHFFDGGVTGLSLLLHELYHFNLAYLIVVLNLPLIILAFFSVGRNFALKTLGAVILLGMCLLFIPYEIITSDKLLISIFGGVFLGLGVGMTMRAGCALDGLEVLALYTLKRTSFTITEIILGFNIVIFGIAAFKFGIETSLYSVLTYFTASRMIDYVIEGIQAYTGVTIISGESEAIKYKLVNELGRGITVYKGERGFLPGKFEISKDCDIIFTVVTRLELRKLKNLVYETDSKAFVFANTIKEASGGIIKRRQVH